MPANTTIKKDRFSTWNIVGDEQTWTLAEGATIDVFKNWPSSPQHAAAIAVAAGNDGNLLVIEGDVENTSHGSIGLYVEADDTEIRIGGEAGIRASVGVSSWGTGTSIINQGDIDGGSSGISSATAIRVANSGTIDGTTAIEAAEGSVIKNLQQGEIWGGDVGVRFVSGANTLINRGLVTGFDVAITDGSGDARIVNRGRIEGDVVLGDGADIFENRGGTVQGTVYGGAGNDRYDVSGKLTIREEAGEGTDTVNSSVSFTLPENIEYLVLGGKGDIDGTGNASNNELFGNGGGNILAGMAGADQLRGGAGNDTLIGGADGDTFLIFPGEGIDTIRDYADGLDKIGIFNFAEIGDISDLSIRQNAKTGDDVWIVLGKGQKIVLEDIDISVLDGSDFYFF